MQPRAEISCAARGRRVLESNANIVRVYSISVISTRASICSSFLRHLRRYGRYTYKCSATSFIVAGAPGNISRGSETTTPCRFNSDAIGLRAAPPASSIPRNSAVLFYEVISFDKHQSPGTFTSRRRSYKSEVTDFISRGWKLGRIYVRR